jgi:hypothetical protein
MSSNIFFVPLRLLQLLCVKKNNLVHCIVFIDYFRLIIFLAITSSSFVTYMFVGAKDEEVKSGKRISLK